MTTLLYFSKNVHKCPVMFILISKVFRNSLYHIFVLALKK